VKILMDFLVHLSVDGLAFPTKPNIVGKGELKARKHAKAMKFVIPRLDGPSGPSTRVPESAA
jgi:hypothetical protein